MRSEPSLQGCVLWIRSSGGLLHYDWFPLNRVIAHYHKVDLISTLLDARIAQNANVVEKFIYFSNSTQIVKLVY